MTIFSKKDSLAFLIKNKLFSCTEECISFLVEQDVLEEDEADEIGTIELFNLAMDELENLSEDELEIVLMSNDISIGIDSFDILNIKNIEEAIDWDSKKWVANCYAVSCAIVEAGLIKGKAVFGKYYGFIDENSFFSGSKFTNHGWILTEEGYIVDPTRWVFENTEPYIYISKSDNADYDRGSNVLKNLLNSLDNPPPFDDTMKIIEIDDLEIDGYFSLFLGKQKVAGKVSINQAISVASASINTLGDLAKPIYQWLVDNKMEVFIPIDNLDMVLNN